MGNIIDKYEFDEAENNGYGNRTFTVKRNDGWWFQALYKVLADSDIMQHYPYTFDEVRVRNWIERNIERYRVFGFGLWAVCLKETDEMIGDCGLTM